MKVIYDKYDPNGFDATNVDELLPENIRQKYRALFESEPDDGNDRASGKFAQTDNPPVGARINQKQLGKEAKKLKEEYNVTKAVRAVYVDLVKAFHPDREPDEAEKERKTGIMHRITEAYQKNNLLSLLRLQLELDQIDHQQLENLAEGQLKYYNKILKQQTQELEAQLYTLQSQLTMMSNQPLHFWTSPARLEHHLSSDVQVLKRELKGIKNNLSAFQNYDVLKQFLKSYRLQKDGDFNGF